MISNAPKAQMTREQAVKVAVETVKLYGIPYSNANIPSALAEGF